MFFIDTHLSHGQALRSTIQKYSFRKSVTLNDLSEVTEVHAIYSETLLPDSEEGSFQKWTDLDAPLEAKEPSADSIDIHGYCSFIDPRSKIIGSRTIAAKEVIENDPEVIIKPTEYFNTFRRLCGVCEGKSVEGQIPHVLNFHTLNAISFNKGCYVGQELVARTQSQGVLRTTVLPFVIDKHNKIQKFSDAINPPMWVIDHEFSDQVSNQKIQDISGKNIGEIIETDKNVGLAKVKIESANEDCFLSDGSRLFFYKPVWLSQLFSN